jgi:glyoxylase-like metal-dependent hydrolase (beta-lactamase superfamily II)
MEIVSRIHRIDGVVGTRPLQLYLLRGDMRTVLLDTGCAPDPERLIFPYLRKLGLTPADVDLVINTHPDLDHCGGNHAMKTAHPGLLIACGEADRPMMEDPQKMWNLRYNAYADPHGLKYDDNGRKWIVEMLGQAQPVDWTWRGGETLRLGHDWVVEIHHTPGHSAGHLSVFDPRSHTMFSGDAVQGSVYLDVHGSPALCPTYLHVDTYLATIQYLESLPIERLATCHWPLKTGPEVRDFLSETRQFVELADRLLLEGLRAQNTALGLGELIRLVGPKLGSWPRGVDPELMYALAGNMDRLVALGKVVQCADTKPIQYGAKSK